MSPCLFNFYAEYIMRNAGLEEAQAGIKIAGKNINNLRYADNTTLMAESEAEQKSLLMKVKEEVRWSILISNFTSEGDTPRGTKISEYLEFLFSVYLIY